MSSELVKAPKVMSKEQAKSLIAQALSEFRGTLKEHGLLQQALNVLTEDTKVVKTKEKTKGAEGNGQG